MHKLKLEQISRKPHAVVRQRTVDIYADPQLIVILPIKDVIFNKHNDTTCRCVQESGELLTGLVKQIENVFMCHLLTMH